MFTNFITWEWNTSDHYGPGMFSPFHIIWLVIMVLLCIGSYFYAKKFNDAKAVDRTILIIDISLLITEILKQIMYQFFYYPYLRIDVLPFSFCSVPLYIALIGALVKNEKIKNACYTFLAFYGIVGGLCAMFYPISLETKLIYVSFQMMYWHTMLVTMAFYLIFAKGYGKSFKKEVIPPFYIFGYWVWITIMREIRLCWLHVWKKITRKYSLILERSEMKSFQNGSGVQKKSWSQTCQNGSWKHFWDC